ncbi:MAG: hypothetical protein J6C53_02430 [Clostridia bacterium]|nr:hypothetical protein [Clostridia bacterium]
MKAWQIILIVCSGLLLLFILFIIGIRRANKKRYYRLRDNLKKVQQEKEELAREGDASFHTGNVKVELSPDVDKMNNHSYEDVDLAELDIEDVSQTPQQNTTDEIKEDQAEFDTTPLLDKTEREREKDYRRDKEFEKFLDEHSFSRKVLDKKMLNKLKQLQPEMQKVLLDNIFTKFDD